QEEIMIEFKLLSSQTRESGPRTDIQTAINKRRNNSRTNRKAYMITVAVAVISLLTFAFYSFIFAGSKDNPGTNDNKTPVQHEKPLKSAKTPDKGTEKNNNKTNGAPGDENNNTGKTDTTTPEKITSPEGPEGVTRVAGDQVTVVLKGKNETSWARVFADGRVVFTGDIKPGEIKQFTGNTAVKFRLGNAGGVEINVNSQELGTIGSSGEVVDKEYTNQ
ncbi:MAG TPA: DUF4115 domain-containing protein, partial [Desulfobacteria bacterium]|nr:DUF4115 domain-containing protein [Desulfobacteria bacterium]